MDKNQALQMIKKTLDLALSNGTIETLEHAAQVIQALQVLQKELSEKTD